ncbi:hypothetical protein Tco_0809691 [Tanacetum coccineum]
MLACIQSSHLKPETISQEDVNHKLLRSLSPEWNTHVVVWRNKTDLDTMSMDDLYNNLEVCTNGAVSITQAVNTVNGVSAANTQVNASNIDNLSDVVICAFLASQPNIPQLAHEDLQHIYLYDLEEMDLRWQIAILTMKVKRFLKNTGRKLTINGNESVSFNKVQRECYKTATIEREHSAKESELNKSRLQADKESTRRRAYLKHPLPRLWCHVMVLVGMTGVIRQMKDLIMHSWLTHLQVLTQSLNKLIESQIVDNYKKGLGYNAVPPPYTRNFMPPTPNLSFTGLEEFVNKLVVKNRKSDEEVSKDSKPSTDDGKKVDEDQEDKVNDNDAK